jgi:lipid II:glycine glycyltransferase (peptidoglycan interpeptide bridge formation enzyme)
MNSEQLQQLRGRIERARAAIARDEQALHEAEVGKEVYKVRNLGTHLEHLRAYLTELLEEHVRLALGDSVAE